MMTTQYLKKALKVAETSVVEVGEELIKYYGNVASELKANSGNTLTDIVTKLDRKTENFLSQEFQKFDPTIGFYGEEFGKRSEARKMWLVDPIDGTGYFIRGLPFCTTMVALVEDHQVVMSVIYDFIRKDIYSAIKGQGAYLNGKPIKVSKRPLNEALISVETRLDGKEDLSFYLNIRKSATTIQGIASGFDFPMIATGKLDGRIAKNPYFNDWDVAPGSFLVVEAGGVATNIGKSTYNYRNHDYVIANPLIHQELTKGSNAVFPIETNK